MNHSDLKKIQEAQPVGIARDDLKKMAIALDCSEPVLGVAQSVRMHDAAFDIAERILAQPTPQSAQPAGWQERQIIGTKDGIYQWSEWYSCNYETDEVIKARRRISSSGLTPDYEWRPVFAEHFAAPAREWVSLTEGAIKYIFSNSGLVRTVGHYVLFARAIETALKTLNAAHEALLHADDLAVDKFAAAMKAKMAKQRAKGRGGWSDTSDCSTEMLQESLRSHIAKGDPVDVGNFAMMLFCRGEGTSALTAAQEPK